MMRLPPFRYHRPTTAAEAAAILAGDGPSAMLVAGGTDLYPNMKRRHQTPDVVVSIGRVDALRGIETDGDGFRLGAGTTLRAIERHEGLGHALPALATAVASISTPLLRTMGTIGGNVCLDTRCNYYDQNWEWRRAIDFCLKCEGDTCWTAPGSDRCWAVNSSDSVPVLMALEATAQLVGHQSEREIPLAGLFQDDGIEYLTKRRDEVLTGIRIPSQGATRSVYRKVRRRGAFDFPVAAVAVRLGMEGDRVASARIVLNAVGSTPVRSEEAEGLLLGQTLTDDRIEEAAAAAFKPAKPLDNTDHQAAWRKKRVRTEVARALRDLRSQFDSA